MILKIHNKHYVKALEEIFEHVCTQLLNESGKPTERKTFYQQTETLSRVRQRYTSWCLMFAAAKERI